MADNPPMAVERRQVTAQRQNSSLLTDDRRMSKRLALVYYTFCGGADYPPRDRQQQGYGRTATRKGIDKGGFP